MRADERVIMTRIINDFKKKVCHLNESKKLLPTELFQNKKFFCLFLNTLFCNTHQLDVSPNFKMFKNIKTNRIDIFLEEKYQNHLTIEKHFINLYYVKSSKINTNTVTSDGLKRITQIINSNHSNNKLLHNYKYYYKL